MNESQTLARELYTGRRLSIYPTSRLRLGPLFIAAVPVTSQLGPSYCPDLAIAANPGLERPKTKTHKEARGNREEFPVPVSGARPLVGSYPTVTNGV